MPDDKAVFITSIEHWSGAKVKRATEGEIRQLAQQHPELPKAMPAE